ncbi:RecF/RecN/SMC N-terminal [Trinorchestia longiramus]|nr:RecF/RecN/SMC N-terminal [Trinorchestia longiramus]
MSVKSILKYIEVENFKSYRGFYTIGPLKSFTAVIGPNGSGKSNFMDAISFVMGERTSSLRVRRLSDLIHGASIGQPISRSAQVTAVFELESGVEKRFTRTVQGSSSDHKIDNRVEKQIELQLFRLYHNEKEMAEHEKEIKRKQADLEKIEKRKEKSEEVLKDKKKELTRVSREMSKLEQEIREMERTLLFEELSGSGVLKEEYDRLKEEMLKAEEETQCTYQKKKGVAAERKEAKMEREEAERYQRLKDELVR